MLVSCNIGKYFTIFSYFAVISKYKKLVKYIPYWTRHLSSQNTFRGCFWKVNCVITKWYLKLSKIPCAGSLMIVSQYSLYYKPWIIFFTKIRINRKLVFSFRSINEINKMIIDFGWKRPRGYWWVPLGSNELWMFIYLLTLSL